MKTSALSLLVNRLLTSVFTLSLLAFATAANASDNNSDNPGIEFASLNASATSNLVLINWVTVSESNNSHFEVERSTDNKEFKTVAMVLDGFAATGNTTGKSYKFKEAAGEVKNGKTVYYRLKQIDNDNQVRYSAVMAVQMNTTVTIYPNNQVLLSKQTISMSVINISAAGSPELTAGVLTPIELILGTELSSPKLTLA